jgi:hypothetical protein
MVSTTKTDRTEKLGITLRISLLQEIDNKRGDIPRSTFIRRAMQSTLVCCVRRLVLVYKQDFLYATTITEIIEIKQSMQKVYLH